MITALDVLIELNASRASAILPGMLSGLKWNDFAVDSRTMPMVVNVVGIAEARRHAARQLLRNAGCPGRRPQ